MSEHNFNESSFFHQSCYNDDESKSLQLSSHSHQANSEAENQQFLNICNILFRADIDFFNLSTFTDMMNLITQSQTINEAVTEEVFEIAFA